MKRKKKITFCLDSSTKAGALAQISIDHQAP
jgi:hypothetical protein